MPLNCLCPHCRRPMSIADQFAGQPMRCPMCAAMFQAPSLAPAAAPPPPAPPPASVKAPASAPAPAARSNGSSAVPPWAAPPPEPSVGNDWPWLSAAPAKPKPAPPGPGDYDWEKVQPLVAMAARLEPGWHLVLRGMSLLTPSAILVFITLGLCWLFVLIGRPVIDTRKIVLLIVVPLTLLGTLSHLFGWFLCCFAPGDLKPRRPAIAGVFGLAVTIGFGLLAVIDSTLLPAGPEEMASGTTEASLAGYYFVVRSSYVLAILTGTATGVAFLLFMRWIATNFHNKRLAEHLMYFVYYLAASPLIALLIYLLMATIKWAFGLRSDDQLRAYEIVLGSVLLVLGAVTMTGFLLLVRDVRSTIERSIAPSKS